MEYSWAGVLFFTMSSVIHIVYSIISVGAQDLLSGSKLQTSVVLIADIVPNLFGQVLTPCIAQRISYAVRFVAVSLLMFAAFMMIGISGDVNVRLFGVALATFAMGVAETSTLALSSYFDSTALSSFSAGSGAGFLLAPLYYTAMTTWFCVSPQITFISIGTLSFLYLLCYHFIHKGMMKRNRMEVAFTKLTSSDDNDSSTSLVTKPQSLPSQPSSSSSSSFTPTPPSPMCDYLSQVDKRHLLGDNELSLNQRIASFIKVLYISGIPAFIAFFSEYTIYQSVITTLAYPSSPFPPRDHYQYYAFSLMIGEVLGRSNRSIIHIINLKMLFKPTMLQLSVICSILVFQLFFLLGESWYRFLPNAGMVIFLCFSTGFLGGAAFAITLELVRTSFDWNEREFALSVSLLPFNCGLLVASLIGLYIEPRLLRYCEATVTDIGYCFTRSFSLEAIPLSCKGL